MEEDLATDIAEFIERETADGNATPDFWDELNTSERLAEWLASKGWVKL